MEKGAKKNTSVRAVPEGFHTVTPYLVVNGATDLIEFIKKAFGGQLDYMMKGENNLVTHATVTVGNSIIMISDTMEGTQPQTAMLYLYVENADEMYKKAIDAKAASVHEPTTEFYGDRAGAVKDKWGNVWWIGTHVEDVEPAELERRAKIAMKERKEKGAEVHA